MCSSLTEHLGDAHAIAITKSQIADILQARGELDEVSHIRREEGLLVYERQDDARSLVITHAKLEIVYLIKK